MSMYLLTHTCVSLPDAQNRSPGTRNKISWDSTGDGIFLAPCRKSYLLYISNKLLSGHGFEGPSMGAAVSWTMDAGS